MSANLENSTMATGLESSVFVPIPKKDNAKECSNYQTIVFISHATKVMLKILQARLQEYVNQELPDVQAGFRKGQETGDQIAKSVGSSKKQVNSRKISAFASLTTLKPLTMWVTRNWKTGHGFHSSSNKGNSKTCSKYQTTTLLLLLLLSRFSHV